jgi:hypothetical protein
MSICFVPCCTIRIFCSSAIRYLWLDKYGCYRCVVWLAYLNMISCTQVTATLTVRYRVENFLEYVIAMSDHLNVYSPHHITPHYTTSHHITPHHITSHHTTSHHITSHHITSRHIKPYPHHIASVRTHTKQIYNKPHTFTRTSHLDQVDSIKAQSVTRNV